MRYEDFETMKEKQKQKDIELNKRVVLLSSTVEQMSEILKWCGKTFPELQEGGEYWDIWEEVENMISYTKKRTKEYKKVSQTKLGPFG